jgi:hypothetical protein
VRSAHAVLLVNRAFTGQCAFTLLSHPSPQFSDFFLSNITEYVMLPADYAPQLRSTVCWTRKTAKSRLWLGPALGLGRFLRLEHEEQATD